jgi:hypothetical protein
MVPDREGDFTTTRKETVMTTSSKTSKVSRAARITAIVAGIQKHFSGQASLQLGNTSFSPAALIALLQGDITLSNKATASRAQLTTDVEAANQSHQTVDPLLRFINALVISQFGDTEASASILGDFGMSPRKVPVKSAEVKAEAAVKLRATRVARGTTGPKQKAKITGVVPAAPPITGAAVVPAPVVKPTA